MVIPHDKPVLALLKLIDLWVSDLLSQHRMDVASIPDFVPPSLRAIYEFAGNYPIPSAKQWRRPNWTYGLFGPQDQLLPVDQLELVNDRFRFIHENQGVWYCETLANQEDPPVYSDALAYEHGDDKFRQVCLLWTLAAASGWHTMMIATHH
ncbi:MAG: hypothetical protein F6K19_12320 [Cyanothece sp. SIO1E1]|nr:hypothetical protein [Cyanothece sp. SIO1E1]